MNGRGVDGDHLYNRSAPVTPNGAVADSSPSRVELAGSGSRSPRPRQGSTGPGTRLCSIVGCDREEMVRGMCSAHYWRWWKNGDVDGSRPIARYRDPEPLVCICRTPQPTPSDMCAACYRVIAEQVHQRRRRGAA